MIDSIGPTGNVDVYTLTADKYVEENLDIENSNIGVIAGVPIVSVGSLTGTIVMFGIPEEYEDRIDEVVAELRVMYPGMTVGTTQPTEDGWIGAEDIVVETIGEGTWAIGETICLSSTDDCEP